MFGYDAVVDSKRRRSPQVQVMSEDSQLRPADRKKLVATARDLPRNYAIAAWMIRKHLDYVSTFGFQARTPNKAFNKRLERLLTQYSRAVLFDVAARHSRQRFLRLAEARRTLDGDVGILKLSSGRVQAIEGDRIRTPIGEIPGGLDPDKIIHGVRVSKGGKAQAYCLCDRSKWGGGFRFNRMVPARHLYLHGYFDRFDQVRGIGLVAPGINTLQDTYENITYALAKAKVSQFFAVKFTRQADEAIGDISGGVDSEGNEDKSEYDVDFANFANLRWHRLRSP
jgi:capsid protein